MSELKLVRLLSATLLGSAGIPMVLTYLLLQPVVAARREDPEILFPVYAYMVQGIILVGFGLMAELSYRRTPPDSKEPGPGIPKT
ncbi:MAG: hypothetical protein KJ749_08945 [Planctomycetes bacterium]|nr:hypothetical protein [Planctomycetota bacterium]